MKLIPMDKQSKKNQREFNNKQRLTWGNVHPSTKTHKVLNVRDERNKDRGKDYESINN